MKYGAVVESIENPGTFGTVQYSRFGVSVHYWYYDRELHKRVMVKTLGTSRQDAAKHWKVVPLPAWGRVDEHGCVVFDRDHCPVCGSKMSQWTDYMSHTLCEARIKCTENDCYLYEFAYGGYAEYVGQEYEWFWSYNSPSEERTKISAESDAAIIKLRENFLKYGVFYDKGDGGVESKEACAAGKEGTKRQRQNS
jgi:hypothetical protein